MGNGVRSHFPPPPFLVGQHKELHRFQVLPFLWQHAIRVDCFCTCGRCTPSTPTGRAEGSVLSADLTPGTWPGFCTRVTRLRKSMTCAKGVRKGFRSRLTKQRDRPLSDAMSVNLVSLG